MKSPLGYPLHSPLGLYLCFCKTLSLVLMIMVSLPKAGKSISQRIPTYSAQNNFDIVCPTA